MFSFLYKIYNNKKALDIGVIWLDMLPEVKKKKKNHYTGMHPILCCFVHF